MKSDPLNQDASSSGEEAGNLCVAYLLGDLDQDAKVAFERRLADDPSLSERLLQQADTILALAPSRGIVMEQSGKSVPQPAQELRPPQRFGGSARWRWVAAIVSTAACIALLVQLTDLSRESDVSVDSDANTRVADHSAAGSPGTSEQILIARAWADNHVDFEETLLDLAVIPEGDAELDESDDFEAVEDSDIDSKVDWMFVAMRSSTSSLPSGDNDG